MATSVEELLSELLKAAELLLNELSKLAGGLSSAVGLHAVPVEGVVEGLGGIVEQRLVLPIGLAKNGDHIITLHLSARDHRVGHGDVLGVVLVVVDTKSLFIESGSQGSVIIWKRRELDSLQYKR